VFVRSRSRQLRRFLLRHVVLALAMVTSLIACQREAELAAPEVRPVRTVTIEKREAGVPVVLTGRIQAQDEAPLAFRISGRMVERRVNRGDRVTPGQVVARLDAQNEHNALTTARANLASAQGQLTNARNDFGRQERLAAHGAASKAALDQSRATFQTAQSQLDAAQAQLRFAEDQVGFTELEADAEGVVIVVGAEPGEVVSAGRMVVTLARQGGRDAVFDFPSQVIRSVPSDAVLTVSLIDDRGVQATGRIREVAPQADPVTRTFEVKVGLSDPPPAMRLGATVVGQLIVDVDSVIGIPATALTQHNEQPAVWVVDPSTWTVSLRTIDVLRYDPDAVVVSKGLAPGDIVVTAGVQALHPGQKVRALKPSG
jgi:RND family efflux transporter MFP subunit